jgi:hypothetical protein
LSSLTSVGTLNISYNPIHKRPWPS